jgi:hypothetical protein
MTRTINRTRIAVAALVAAAAAAVPFAAAPDAHAGALLLPAVQSAQAEDDAAATRTGRHIIYS